MTEGDNQKEELRDDSKEETTNETVEDVKGKGRLFMVIVDHDASSHRALRAALAESTGDDTLHLLNVTSNWDYLNDEKNRGRAALYEAEEYALRATEVMSFPSIDPLTKQGGYLCQAHGGRKHQRCYI